MTGPRDLDHVLGAYLQDGPTELPDRSYDDVRTVIDSTKQWAVIGPWRFPTMTLFTRVATLAVVVLALSVAGVSLLPRSSGVGGEVASPMPSPSPTPTVSPLPLPTGEGVMPLAPGTYLTQDPFLSRVTFTLPAGPMAWEGNIGGPYAVFLGDATEDLLRFQVFDSVYADPCSGSGTQVIPRPGPAVDDLATTLASLPGLTVTPPTDVTLGGVQGKELTMTAPTTVGCRVWILPLGATNDMVAGERQRVWILDVGGQRLVIDAPETPAMTAEQKAIVQSVLDSIQIAPAPAAPTISPGEPTVTPPGVVVPSPSAG